MSYSSVFLLLALFFIAPILSFAEQEQWARVVFENDQAARVENIEQNTPPQFSVVRPAPRCIAPEVLTRYPDTFTRLQDEAVCQNARMKAVVFAEEVDAAASSIAVLEEKARLLRRTAELMAPVKRLEDFGESILLPVGGLLKGRAISSRTWTFKVQCVLSKDQITNGGTGAGEVLGLEDNKVVGRYDEYLETFAKASSAINFDLPRLVYDMGRLLKMPETSEERKVGIKKVMAEFLELAPYGMIVDRRAVQELMPGLVAKGTVPTTVSVSLSSEKPCKDKNGKDTNERFYTLILGNRKLSACFDPENVEVSFIGVSFRISLTNQLKKGATQQLKMIEGYIPQFKRDEKSASDALAALKTKHQRCFGR